LAINRVDTRTTRSPRAIRNRSNEPDTCRQSSSAQTRSRPRPRPVQHPVKVASANHRGLVVEHFARRGGDSGDGVRALVMSAPSTTISCVPFFSRLKWTPGGHGLLGAGHAPFKSRRTSPTGDERHNKEVRPPAGQQPQRESARRRSGPLRSVGHHRPSEITTASLQADAPLTRSCSTPLSLLVETGAVAWTHPGVSS
jgi:hypothetical protein